MEERTQGMGPTIACGVFPDEVTAERAVVDLLNAGFPEESISVSMMEPAAAQRFAEKRRIRASAAPSAVPTGFPTETTQGYQGWMSRGGVLLSINCGGQCSQAMDMINKAGAQMTACMLQGRGAPPRVFHDPDEYAEMEHMRQPGEAPEKPGEFRPEFYREDQLS